MKTLEQYLRDAPVIDHVIRTGQGPDGSVSFYIHPQGADGETLDFGVCGNSLAPLSNGAVQFDFGVALAVLKSGGRVAREGWNGKGMWLAKVEGCEYNVKANSALVHQLGCAKLPWLGMKTAGDEFVPWLASQTDMLAEDWVVVAGWL